MITLLGTLILIRSVQLAKALLLTVVTLLPIMALARLAQPANTLAPIIVTLLGMVTEVSGLFLSALLPICMRLPLLAKITDAALKEGTQSLGIFPVIAETTCAPEESKALEVVIGAMLVCGNDKPKPSFGMAVYPAL